MNGHRPFPPEHGFVAITSPGLGLHCSRPECQRAKDQLVRAQLAAFFAWGLCALLAYCLARTSMSARGGDAMQAARNSGAHDVVRQDHRKNETSSDGNPTNAPGGLFSRSIR